MSDAANEVAPDYDTSVWIEVPVSFPAGPWPTVDAWADDLATAAAREGEQLFENAYRIRFSATAVGSIVNPDAARRLWYYPVDDGGMAVAHVYHLDRTALDIADAERELADHPLRVTDPVVTDLDPGGAERLVQVAFLARTGEEAEAPVMGIVRIARVTASVVIVVEMLDADLPAFQQVLPALVELTMSLEVPEAAAS